jgi:hypothetical protein
MSTGGLSRHHQALSSRYMLSVSITQDQHPPHSVKYSEDHNLVVQQLFTCFAVCRRGRIDGGRKQKREEYQAFLLSYDLFSRLVYSMPVMHQRTARVFPFSRIHSLRMHNYWVLYLTTTLKVGFTVCMHLCTNVRPLCD